MKALTIAEINSTIHTTSQPTHSTAHCRKVAHATGPVVVVFLGASFIKFYTFNKNDIRIETFAKLNLPGTN